MSKRSMNVAVIGFGYWGPNLVRNFTACPTTEVVAIADKDPGRRAAAGNTYRWTRVVDDADEIFSDPAIDAVALATPLFTHYPLAKRALEAGKHVLVEKPLASSVAECEELKALAAARGLVIMVDHTFVYTGAVRKIRELVSGGHLGRVLYFDSVRINLGLFQPDFNVVWDLAPHDLSIIDYVLGLDARWVSAIGANHYGKHENLAYLTIGFDDELLAHVHCNWVAPVKTRRITIAGTERMLVYDDTTPAERVKVYESGVNVADVADAEHGDPETTYRMNVQYRTGDVHAPKLDPTEALRLMVKSFADACLSDSAPPSDIDAGIRVVRMLAAAQESIAGHGQRVIL
jgi:predicted dehydrogenase